MFCPNCGGEYAEWALKCPYCGSVNDRGAEKAYMEHMEELKQRLGKVDSESADVYRKTISKSLRNVLIIFGCALAAVLLIVGIVFAVGRKMEADSERHYQDQVAFEKEEFPKLDALYEAGDYDAILDEYYRVVLADNGLSIYRWPHFNFVCEYYEMYRDILTAEADIEKNEIYSSTLGIAIYDSLKLKYEEDEERMTQMVTSYEANNGSYGLTEEECEVVQDVYRPEAEHFLKDVLGFSEAGCNELYESCLADGYLKMALIYEKTDELIKEKGWEVR